MSTVNKLITKVKGEEIIVDGCTCGKSRLSMIKYEYCSDHTSDVKLKGSMRDYGLAWVYLLDGYILEIDSINNTRPYRRSATHIVLNKPLSKNQVQDRKRRLETLARCHPGLYEAIRVIAKKEEIEPIKTPLARIDKASKKKRLDGLRRERERKQHDVKMLDEEIKKYDPTP